MQDILTSDPFAVVSIGAQTIGRTKVVMRNLNPTWNAQFSCALLHCNAVMRVSLFDFDYSSSDDDMGYVEVKLSRLTIDDTEDFCLPILRDAKTLGKGTIRLRACISVSIYITFGLICFSYLVTTISGESFRYTSRG